LIVAVGRFERKKGFPVLVAACDLLCRRGILFRCELIGQGPEERTLREQIEAFNLSSQVHLIPWQTPEQLRAAYCGASVLAVPSVVADDGDRDNIPNVILEGLACGLPVVASSLPAINDVFGPAAAIELVPPGDPDLLAQALLRVCSDPLLTAGLRQRGRDVLHQHFDRENNNRQLLAVLSESWRSGGLNRSSTVNIECRFPP
jgi:glycosyltransferase involved in cell wall biosynthesis